MYDEYEGLQMLKQASTTEPEPISTPLTPEQSKKFWIVVMVISVVSIALILAMIFIAYKAGIESMKTELPPISAEPVQAGLPPAYRLPTPNYDTTDPLELLESGIPLLRVEFNAQGVLRTDNLLCASSGGIKGIFTHYLRNGGHFVPATGNFVVEPGGEWSEGKNRNLEAMITLVDSQFFLEPVDKFRGISWAYGEVVDEATMREWFASGRIVWNGKLARDGGNPPLLSCDLSQ